jgi:hypothetical protein
MAPPEVTAPRTRPDPDRELDDILARIAALRSDTASRIAALGADLAPGADPVASGREPGPAVARAPELEPTPIPSPQPEVVPALAPEPEPTPRPQPRVVAPPVEAREPAEVPVPVPVRPAGRTAQPQRPGRRRRPARPQRPARPPRTRAIRSAIVRAGRAGHELLAALTGAVAGAVRRAAAATSRAMSSATSRILAAATGLLTSARSGSSAASARTVAAARATVQRSAGGGRRLVTAVASATVGGLAALATMTGRVRDLGAVALRRVGDRARGRARTATAAAVTMLGSARSVAARSLASARTVTTDTLAAAARGLGLAVGSAVRGLATGLERAARTLSRLPRRAVTGGVAVLVIGAAASLALRAVDEGPGDAAEDVPAVEASADVDATVETLLERPDPDEAIAPILPPDAPGPDDRLDGGPATSDGTTTNGPSTMSPEPTPAPPPRQLPTLLRIPAIGVEAPTVPVGLVADGAMEIPVDVSTIGWYEPGEGVGVAPGQIGTAVLAGHVDSRTQGAGAFYRLRDLAVGDEVVIEHADGGSSTWRITEVIQYPKDQLPIDEVFVWDGPPRLALITCGGAFDWTVRSYTDNLVVHAEPVVVAADAPTAVPS